MKSHVFLFSVVQQEVSWHFLYIYTGTRRIHKIHRSDTKFDAVSNSIIGGRKQSTARSWEKNSMASWSYTSCFSRIMATLGDFMDASICHGIDREGPEVADTLAVREKAKDKPCPCNLLRYLAFGVGRCRTPYHNLSYMDGTRIGTGKLIVSGSLRVIHLPMMWHPQLSPQIWHKERWFPKSDHQPLVTKIKLRMCFTWWKCNHWFDVSLEWVLQTWFLEL